ncbi:MAG: pyridoxal phosphate-dependent aminotransferase [Gemmatimonadales bacterium]|nr:MAG: pyridoxal phosphate-dependent aminotransferase [Gemmatimonadales bacterium]
MEFSSNIASLQPSATMAVSSLAKQLRAEGRDVIDLSAGEPDFPTPSWISDGAMDAVRAGRTRYTPAPGLPELRKAVADDLSRRSLAGWSCSPEAVVITAGAKQAMYNACFALFGPGDDVLVASPYWTSYPQMVGLSGARPVPVRGPEEMGFKLRPEDLEAAAGDSTRGLILCSPCNPTGSVYSLKELEAVAQWARERGIWLMSDEIYRRIVFTGSGGDAPSLSDIPQEKLGPHVLVDGASKCFAMTGWRIGYSVTDPEVARKLAAFQSHTTSNAATPSQWAALRALSDPVRAQDSIGNMVTAFLRRRNLMVEGFRRHLPDLTLVEPEGAFYLFFRVDGEYTDAVPDSQTWCSRVLETTGVALVPGAAFGDDRYVRLSYATSDDLLAEALRRLVEDRG